MDVIRGRNAAENGAGRRHPVAGLQAIRGIQYGLFDARKIGTAFYKGQSAERNNPDFAAWARAYGADGLTGTKPQELAAAVQQALNNRRPCVIDTHVDPEVSPPLTGTWQLPPIPHKEPVFGKTLAGV